MNCAADECGQDEWEMIDYLLHNYRQPVPKAHTMEYSVPIAVKLDGAQLPFWSLLGS